MNKYDNVQYLKIYKKGKENESNWEYKIISTMLVLEIYNYDIINPILIPLYTIGLIMS